jgi:hypothetical protein
MDAAIIPSKRVHGAIDADLETTVSYYADDGWDEATGHACIDAFPWQERTRDCFDPHFTQNCNFDKSESDNGARVFFL